MVVQFIVVLLSAGLSSACGIVGVTPAGEPRPTAPPAAAPVSAVAVSSSGARTTSLAAFAASFGMRQVSAAAGGGVNVDQTPVTIDRSAAARRRPTPAAQTPPSGEAPVDPTVAPVVAGTPDGTGRLLTPPVDTSDVQTIGVTWPEGTDGAALEPQVRVLAQGQWSGWRPLGTSDAAPDSGTADAAHQSRAGTDSLWIGNATAVQMSFAGAPSVPDVRLALIGSTPLAVVGPGGSGGARPGAGLHGQAPVPSVYPRAAWGARPPVCTPAVADTLDAAVVHHTADSNSYGTVAEAMQQIRNDQAYHIDSRGWCDIGYNFVVDKWGNVYEGREHSGDEPVIGVHAGGFNTATVGIAMLGDYSTVTPPAATQESVAEVIAWRLGAYNRDPSSTIGYTTLGGETSRYAAGTWLALPTVIGHREVDLTACPGQAGYSTIGWLRARAKALIGAGWVNPAASPASAPMGTPVTIAGATLGPLAWRLTVSDERTGIVMSTSSGSVDEKTGGPLAQWNGNGPAGTPVGPGPYRLTLTGANPTTGSVAAPWIGHVDVVGSQDPPSPPPVPLVGNLTFVPVAPQRLLDTRPTGQSLGPTSRLDLTVAGVAGVPIDARAVALNVTAVDASTVTFLRAWPAGAPAPSTSLLNTGPGRTSASGGVVAVGGGGAVSLYNDAGSLHLVVDVTGYFTDAAGAGSAFAALGSAARLLDTRTDGAIPSGQTRSVTIAGAGGVPPDATAVVLNATSVGPVGNGYVSVVPHGADPRATSTVNHLPGQNVSNRATVPLAGGAVDVHVEGSDAGVVLDVVGWYGPSGELRLTPIAPVRVLDTRTGTQLGAQGMLTFPISSAISAVTGARAAVATVTATRQTAFATYITLWSAGGVRPPTSDLNTGAGRDQANMTLLTWNSAAQVAAYNDQGSADLVVDVYALFG
jgi:hypothetical protein